MKHKHPLFFILLSFAAMIGCCGCAADPALPPEETGALTETPSTAPAETAPEETAPAEKEPLPSFDETKIVFSFGAISDVHISVSATKNKGMFTNALNQLLAEAAKSDPNGLRGLVVAGDMVSNTSKGDKSANLEISRFATILSDYKAKSLGTNVLVAVGNHDTRSTLTFQPSLKETYLGADYYAMDVDSDLEKGYRHSVLFGYHFLIVEPASYGYGTPFAAEVLTWIDHTLADLTAKDPSSYVFVVTHPTIADTTYGSEADHEPGHSRWRTENLGAVLEKYPQVIVFTGHTHTPVFDERSIMQTAFTAVNCGSTSNTAFELEKYDNMENDKTQLAVPNGDVSTGLLVQIDEGGNVRITRLLFSEKKEIKTAWELPAPQADGSHLTLYRRAEREAANAAPSLSGPLTLTAGDGHTLTLSLPAGTDDDFVHHYEMQVVDTATGKTEKTVLAVSDFYARATAAEMQKTFTYSITMDKAGSYRVLVKAVDSWDAVSGTVSAEITLP
ncbi:MAG: metallophosphoesterase [Clostridia bacterium]|nr:metallophosphoesterase [Clostridia bacterium]